jgi:hypothetical protein
VVAKRYVGQDVKPRTKRCQRRVSLGANNSMLGKSIGGKVALVCGAGGFIGHHLVRRLKREGFWVRGTDLKFPRFSETEADDFAIMGLHLSPGF